MPARIAKYPPIAGTGIDVHMVLPPSMPPVPPSPVNPAPIPSMPWIVAITSPLSGFVLTGKWSWYKVTTEGVGNVLFGHDWGFAQGHIPWPPVTASASMALRTLSSQTKYWLPSTSNQEPQDGSASGGPSPVAVSTPAFMVPTQNCQDISSWPFCAPTSISFQLVSTREVGFTWGDLLCGAINMASDSVCALIGRAIGGPPDIPVPWKEVLQDAVKGVAVNVFVTHVVGLLPAESQNFAKILVSGSFTAGIGGNGGDVANAIIAPAVEWGGSEAGSAASGANVSAGGANAPVGHGGTPLF